MKYIKLTELQLIKLYRQAEDYFFEGIASKFFDLGEGANAYMTEVPVADLNLIYVTRNTGYIERILRQGRQFFDEIKIPFVVIIPQKFCSDEMESVLEDNGYHQTGKSVSMAMGLDEMTANIATSFDDKTIIRANNNHLNDWMAPLVGAFESTFEISSQYARTHERALQRKLNLQHFSLYKQETPVSSITLSLHDNIARIDDVGTLPELQGNGYATRLMTFVLSQAKKSDAHYCFLESSESGFSIYQKLGFNILFKNNIYSRKV